MKKHKSFFTPDFSGNLPTKNSPTVKDFLHQRTRYRHRSDVYYSDATVRLFLGVGYQKWSYIKKNRLDFTSHKTKKIIMTPYIRVARRYGPVILVADLEWSKVSFNLNEGELFKKINRHENILFYEVQGPLYYDKDYFQGEAAREYNRLIVFLPLNEYRDRNLTNLKNREAQRRAHGINTAKNNKTHSKMDGRISLIDFFK